MGVWGMERKEKKMGFFINRRAEEGGKDLHTSDTELELAFIQNKYTLRRRLLFSGYMDYNLLLHAFMIMFYRNNIIKKTTTLMEESLKLHLFLSSHIWSH